MSSGRRCERSGIKRLAAGILRTMEHYRHLRHHIRARIKRDGGFNDESANRVAGELRSKYDESSGAQRVSIEENL